MISRESEGGGERYVELHFLAGDRTVAASNEVGNGMDAARLHRVERGEDPRSVVVKVRPLLAESRSSNSISDGELTRVGTLGVENGGDPLVRATSETWETRGRFRPDIVDALSPCAGMRPVKVAPVIEVACRERSRQPTRSRISRRSRDGWRSRFYPSGLPVLKKGVSAAAAAAGSKPISATEIASFACVLDIALSPRNAAFRPRMDGPWAANVQT